MKRKDYDFAGWVTKNDTLCSDGVVIKHNAFKDTNEQVPLVWNHDHSSPTNVLGHVILEHRDKGVYGYGYFNDTESGQDAKAMVQHGDISSMSIGANKIKKRANEVVHGIIREVSLVMAGANPGAVIESIAHSEEGIGIEDIVFTTGTLIHSSDDIIDDEEYDEDDDYIYEDEEDDSEYDYDDDEEDYDDDVEHSEGDDSMSDKTVGEVMATLNAEQEAAVEIVIGAALEDNGGDDNMKHNTFEGTEDDTLFHGEEFGELVMTAMQDNSSLKHAASEYGIENIEILFPEAQTVGDPIQIYKDQNTNTGKILAKFHKSPFANVKTVVADLTEKEARARGYVKGEEKFEQVFPIMTRKIGPQTIYKKQKLDRDDIVDITDYNVVGFIQSEMRMMLNEEIVRACLVGDGREITDADKIKEDHIKPIIKDDDFYTTKLVVDNPADVLEAVIYALADYQGSGVPDLYLHPTMAAALKLVKDATGKYLFGDIPTLQNIAARLGVSEIIPTSFLTKNDILIVNLADYTIGATKGGQTTTFEDFDIDFNQHKYLIETRLSGALTVPKSAIHVKVTNVELKSPAVKVVTEGNTTP